MNFFIFTLSLLLPILSLASGPTGNHFSDCYAFGQNDRHSFVMTAYLKDKKFYSAFRLFQDKNCQEPSLTVIYGSNYSLGEKLKELTEFDHNPTHVFMVLLDENVVDFYNDPNQPEGCGYKDWEINIPKDVNGLFCHPYQMPKIGEQLYDVIKYQKNSLQFGGIPFNWNLTDRSQRPAKVHSVIFRK